MKGLGGDGFFWNQRAPDDGGSLGIMGPIIIEGTRAREFV